MTAARGTGTPPDLGWLRRRRKPGDPPATPPPSEAAQAASSLSSSLSLGGAAAAAAASLVPPPQAGPAVRRAREGRTLLTAEEPTVTFDRRQSAIGSMEIRLAGPGWIGALWELTDGTAGLVSAPSGTTTSPEYGRRCIVELREARLLVGLRHIRELRRLVILCGGASGQPGEPPRRLAFLLYGGESVECVVEPVEAQFGEHGVVAAVAGYQIDGELLLRREGFGIASSDAAAQAYGVHNTWLPPIRAAG